MSQTQILATDINVTASCPQCLSRLVAEYDEMPWCERCEWGLDALVPDPLLGRISQRLAKWQHSIGYRLNRNLFAELSQQEVTRPRVNLAFVVQLIVSLILLACIAALLAGGLALIVTGLGLMKLVGVVMIGTGWTLRPRLGRFKLLRERYDEITRENAPRLFELLDRSADAIGSPRPRHVLVGPEWNAFATLVGLRRRKVLMIGLPLWAAARPQERVAILGHELGHFINHDLRRGLITQAAMSAPGVLAHLLDPAQLFEGAPPSGIFGLITRIGELLARPFLWTLSRLCWLTQLGLFMIGARDSQRAEYYADVLAIRLAGSRAATFCDLLAAAEGAMAVTGSRARGKKGFTGWHEAVEELRAEQAERLPRLRQLTQRREASPFASHPPSGLRHRLMSGSAYQEPKIVLTETEASLIDLELSRYEERYRRIVAESW